MWKVFGQWWSGTILYIFTIGLMPNSKPYVDFIVKIANDIKKFWVDYLIKDLQEAVHFVMHLF